MSVGVKETFEPDATRNRCDQWHFTTAPQHIDGNLANGRNDTPVGTGHRCVGGGQGARVLLTMALSRS
jgi:hypothetical protein